MYREKWQFPMFSHRRWDGYIQTAKRNGHDEHASNKSLTTPTAWFVKTQNILGFTCASQRDYPIFTWTRNRHIAHKAPSPHAILSTHTTAEIRKPQRSLKTAQHPHVSRSEPHTAQRVLALKTKPHAFQWNCQYLNNVMGCRMNFESHASAWSRGV